MFSDSEDIEAYVKGITSDIATEIKSEIREVIAQVEDVLENTDSLELNSINMSLQHISRFVFRKKKYSFDQFKDFAIILVLMKCAMTQYRPQRLPNI